MCVFVCYSHDYIYYLKMQNIQSIDDNTPTKLGLYVQSCMESWYSGSEREIPWSYRSWVVCPCFQETPPEDRYWCRGHCLPCEGMLLLLLNFLQNVTFNNISVIYVTAHANTQHWCVPSEGMFKHAKQVCWLVHVCKKCKGMLTLRGTLLEAPSWKVGLKFSWCRNSGFTMIS